MVMRIMILRKERNDQELVKKKFSNETRTNSIVHMPTNLELNFTKNQEYMKLHAGSGLI